MPGTHNRIRLDWTLGDAAIQGPESYSTFPILSRYPASTSIVIDCITRAEDWSIIARARSRSGRLPHASLLCS